MALSDDLDLDDPTADTDPVESWLSSRLKKRRDEDRQKRSGPPVAPTPPTPVADTNGPSIGRALDRMMGRAPAPISDYVQPISHPSFAPRDATVTPSTAPGTSFAARVSSRSGINRVIGDVASGVETAGDVVGNIAKQTVLHPLDTANEIFNPVRAFQHGADAGKRFDEGINDLQDGEWMRGAGKMAGSLAEGAMYALPAAEAGTAIEATRAGNARFLSALDRAKLNAEPAIQGKKLWAADVARQAEQDANIAAIPPGQLRLPPGQYDMPGVDWQTPLDDTKAAAREASSVRDSNAGQPRALLAPSPEEREAAARSDELVAGRRTVENEPPSAISAATRSFRDQTLDAQLSAGNARDAAAADATMRTGMTTSQQMAYDALSRPRTRVGSGNLTALSTVAGGGVGAAAGAALDPDHPVEGAIAGGVAGAGIGAFAPRGLSKALDAVDEAALAREYRTAIANGDENALARVRQKMQARASIGAPSPRAAVGAEFDRNMDDFMRPDQDANTARVLGRDTPFAAGSSLRRGAPAAEVAAPADAELDAWLKNRTGAVGDLEPVGGDRSALGDNRSVEPADRSAAAAPVPDDEAAITQFLQTKGVPVDGATAEPAVPLFHGSSKADFVGEDRPLYLTKDRGFAESYATERSREGGTPTVHELQVPEGAKLATAADVENAAKTAGVDSGISLAADAAHPKVRAELEAQGFEGIQDVPDFGFRSDFEEQPTTMLFDGRKARTGAIAPEATAALAGGAAGGVGGSMVGDTPEERKRNAVIGAMAGAGVAAAGVRAVGAGARRTAAATASTPALERAAGTVAAGEREAGKAASFLTAPEKAYTDLVDEVYPLAKFGRTLDKADPERLSRTIAVGQGWRASARQYMDDALKPIVQSAKGKEADVQGYLVAQREQQLRAQGAAPKTKLTDAEIASAVRDGDADPVVKNTARRLQQYYRDLLKQRLDVGLLTQDKYDAIVKSEDYYTPFVREWDNAGAAGSSANNAGKFTNRGSGVRAMDRDQLARADIRDPFEQAVLDGAETFRQVAKQRVTNVVADIAAANPNSGLITEIPNGTAKAPTARTVEGIVGGERKAFEVNDRDLHDAWAAFDNRSAGIAEKIGGAFKRVLQGGVTLLPDFAAANFIRDTGGAAVQQPAGALAARAAGGAAAGFATGAAKADPDESKFLAGLKGAGYGAGAATLAPQMFRALGAMKNIIGNDAVYQDFLRSGASTEGFYPRNPADARKMLEKMRSSGIDPKDIITPSKWVDALHAIGNTAEASTRLAKYKEAIAGGAAPDAAALAAQDVSLRFANAGKRTKGIAGVTAFWNAKVQGWDKLARMVSDPKTAAAGVATLTAPSLALWATNKDNPEYWDRPQWERNMFWLVPKTDGGFYRIPKPFELGFMFASVPERFADFAYQRANGGTDARPDETLQQGIKDLVGNTMEGTVPIPTALTPMIEEGANYDLFRQRPIVTRPDLPPEMQQDDRTSFVAKTMGEKLGISPQRIDHVMRSFTGSTGAFISDMVDRTARRLGADDRAAPANVPTPLTQRFVTQDAGTTDQEQTLRRRWSAADQVYRGAQNLAKQIEAGDDPAKLNKYLDDHIQDLAQREQLKKSVDALNEIATRRAALRSDRRLTADERRDRFRVLRQLGRDIAGYGLQVPEKPLAEGKP